MGLSFAWDPRQGLWVGKFEVTNWQYTQFRCQHRVELLAAEERRLSRNDRAWRWAVLAKPQHPVVWVTYEEAAAFASWLSDREARCGRLPSGWTYRLPTGREWLSFAGEDGANPYPWGTDLPPPDSWNYADGEPLVLFPGGSDKAHNDGYPATCPVTASGRTSAGLYGVGGNAWEMTAGEHDRTGRRLARGGSWETGNPKRLACSSSMPFAPGTRALDIGFRLVLAPSSAPGTPF